MSVQSLSNYDRNPVSVWSIKCSILLILIVSIAVRCKKSQGILNKYFL